MYHSVTFRKAGASNVNTWNDWYLYSASRPAVPTPQPKTVTIDIPGADGSIDLTEALTGRVTYQDIASSLNFIVSNDKDISWVDLYSEIKNYLHGQRAQMILEDDPNYYYEGRFTVGGWNTGAHYSTITINYVVSPYKFELEQKSIKYTLNNSTQTTSVAASSMPIVPTFEVRNSTDGIRVTFEGVMYTIQNGTTKIPEFVLKNGTNIIRFQGTGTIEMTYRGGKL